MVVVMRRSPLVPVLLALVLSLTACGSRLDSQTRAAAAAVALTSPRDGAARTDRTDLTVGSENSASGASAGTRAAPVGTTSGRSSGDTPADTSAASSAGPVRTTIGTKTAPAPAPAGGNGGSVDVGVTADSITVGNISDLSGPVPGLFQGAVTGTQAYFAKVNAAGGIFGRKLKIKIGDGQLDCDQNKAQHHELIPKVFALVGSFSLYDSCGASVLKDVPGIPDVHNALASAALELPNNFSVAPLVHGWRTGSLAYYQHKYGERFKRVGTIYADAGGGARSWAGAKQAIESLGGAVAYERGFTPTETDFTADIVGMQRNGVQMIYITAADAPTVARLMSAARQQNVDWPLIAGGVAYDEGFTKRAGSAAEGVFNDQQFALFFNRDEADRMPAVKDFQTWTDKVAPGQKKDLFAVYGWTSAQLFVQALTAAGPKAKRADVLGQLRRINKFDADGLIASADPAGKRPSTCWLLTVVKDGQFQRVSPATGFRCDGTYYYAK